MSRYSPSTLDDVREEYMAFGYVLLNTSAQYSKGDVLPPEAGPKALQLIRFIVERLANTEELKHYGGKPDSFFPYVYRCGVAD